MYARILIPTDGSKLSGKAVAEGMALARTLGSAITVLMATPTYRMLTLDPVMSRDSLHRYEAHSRAAARKVLKDVQQAAAVAGVGCKLLHVVSDHPAKEILRAAGRGRIDLIVMASHGRKGISGLLLGSETQKVINFAKIPVLVCR